MKKIIFVIPSFAGGGAERILVNILKYLNRQKFLPKVITFEPKNDYVIPKDIEIICLNKKNKIDFFKLLFLISKYIKLENPNLVVSFLDYANYLVLLSKKIFNLKPPVIISERNAPDENLSNQRYKEIKKFLIKMSYKLASGIICVSNGVKNSLRERYNLAEDKCFVVYNGIDLEEVKLKSLENVDEPFFSWIKEKIPIITACGRLSIQKNYPLLMRCFKKILNYIDARLVIIGKGELEMFLKNYVRELGIENKVLFLGFQHNPFKYIAKSTVFVLSSLWEGFPNVLLEAMACGVSVVSTDCPFGPNEIIVNGKNGILVPNNDESALSTALISVLKDESLRKKLVNKALESVEKFKIENMVSNYEKIFELIVR